MPVVERDEAMKPNLRSRPGKLLGMLHAVLKHEPDGAPSVPRGWRYWAEDGLVTPRPKK